MKTRWVIVGLLSIPLVDTLLLVPIATAIGLLTTVLIVVLTGLFGMVLVRAEGRTTIQRIQQKIARGTLPTNELIDGGLLIAAGAFLLTPGIVTDIIGFASAIPVTRYPIRILTKRYIVTPILDRQTNDFISGNIYIDGFPDEDTVNLDPEEYGRPDEDR